MTGSLGLSTACPRNIVIDIENPRALRFRRPGILPETIIIDHGKLEQIVREWIATVYQLRPHAGLVDSHLPAVKMSPAQKLEQGLAVADRIRVPANPNLLLEMLPVVKRQFNHHGVEVGGLRYNGVEGFILLPELVFTPRSDARETLHFGDGHFTKVESFGQLAATLEMASWPPEPPALRTLRHSRH